MITSKKTYYTIMLKQEELNDITEAIYAAIDKRFEKFDPKIYAPENDTLLQNWEKIKKNLEDINEE